MPRENGMLLLAGNEDAWKALPIDLVSRLAGNEIIFRVLRLSEAVDIIRLYLTPSDLDFQKDDPNPDISPFSQEAIRELVKYSAGNIRLLLQLCSATFDLAARDQSTIDVEIVRTALKQRQNAYFSEKDAVADITRIIVEHGLRANSEFGTSKGKVDVVAVGNDTKPLLLIEVSSAVFHQQEAQRALDNVRRIERIRQGDIATPIVLVVLGYASPEVIEMLSSVVRDVIIYHPDSFPKKFSSLLVELKNTRETSVFSDDYAIQLEAQLAKLKLDLSNTLASRESEIKILERRLAELFEQQNVSSLRERNQDARTAWFDERRRIEERIQIARSERRKKELQQFGQMRHALQERRERRADMMNATLTIGLVVAAIGSALFVIVRLLNYYGNPYSLREISVPEMLRVIVGDVLFIPFIVVLSLLFVVRTSNIFKSLLVRDSVGPPDSLEEIERIAAEYSDRSTTSERVKILINSYDPYRRYAAARMAKPEDEEVLLRALWTEKSRIVSRAIARRIGSVVDTAHIDLSLLKTRKEDFVYIVEAVAQREDVPYSWVTQLPSYVRTVALLYRSTTTGDQPTTLVGGFVFMLKEATRHEGKTQSSLVEAFLQPTEHSLARAVSKYGIPDLRQSMRELSPFDEGGLGTYDELDMIEEIDHYYLFFSQLLFLAERNFSPGERQSVR